MISLAVIAFNFVGDGLRDCARSAAQGRQGVAALMNPLLQAGLCTALLSVRDLMVDFNTDEGLVRRAVNGVSFDLDTGEIVALVGESGCGKSVTALALLRLIADPPGRISRRRDSVSRAQDLLQASEATDPRDPRQPHRHDLPGADDQPEPGLHHRPPGRASRSSCTSIWRQRTLLEQVRGAAEPPSTSPSRGCALAPIPTNSAAACVSG